MSDTIYQKRYLAHQDKKRKQITQGEGFVHVEGKMPNELTELMHFMGKRRSHRVFTNEPIDDVTMKRILTGAAIAPNSCNRHGIKLMVISERHDKALLAGLMVGGVGWMHRADKIVLLLADPDAYASPNEKDFMHYLDAGFAAMSMWLLADAAGVGACFVNPNVQHEDVFKDYIEPNHILCGALVLGYYDKMPFPPEQVTLDEILIC